MRILNNTNTHLSITDGRGRSIVVPPGQCIKRSLNEIKHLDGLIDKGIIQVLGDEEPEGPIESLEEILETPPPLEGSRIIKVAPGIGDILWIIMKLEATGEKFHWRIAGDHPQRGHQIFEVLPQTVASVTYDPTFNANHALDRNIQNKMKTWKEIGAHSPIYLTINRHFEAIPSGNFKDWLPDLPINYYPDYQTQPFIEHANQLLSDKSAKYVGCYGSSYSTSRHWGGWYDGEWAEFILRLRQRDSSIVPVIIGANWDIDIATRLMERLVAHHIPFVRLIGENLGLVVEIMKRLRYGVYFPSGIGIIAGTLGVPGTMWYPPKLSTMPGKWCDPKLTEQGIFHEIEFCSPEQMFNNIEAWGGIK